MLPYKDEMLANMLNAREPHAPSDRLFYVPLPLSTASNRTVHCNPSLSHGRQSLRRPSGGMVAQAFEGGAVRRAFRAHHHVLSCPCASNSSNILRAADHLHFPLE
jgi:hypothetical protein